MLKYGKIRKLSKKTTTEQSFLKSVLSQTIVLHPHKAFGFHWSRENVLLLQYSKVLDGYI